MFDIDPRLALPCVFVSHFPCAVTNVAVTPAAEPFDAIVGCNTFEGVAANYRCTISFRLFILWVAVRSNYVSKRGYPEADIVADAYASRLALADQFVHRGSIRG